MLDYEDMITKFRTFFERYYYNSLLTNIKKGKKYINIKFGDLAKFDLDLSEELISKPQEILDLAEKSLKEFDIPEAEHPIRVRVIDLPQAYYLSIRNIRSSHLGKLIWTEGLIRQASDIRPKVTIATFECPSCNAQIVVEQRDTSFKEPARCQCGRKGKFRLSSKKMVDVQRLVIEEVPESLSGGEQPKRIRAYLSEDLLDADLEKRRYPGNKVRIAGVIKEVPVSTRTGGRSTTYDLMIDANSAETVEEEFGELQISAKDEELIKDLASKSNIFEKLARSIAPSIYGLNEIKQAIVLQLFGGTRKTREDGTSTRGDIHIFLVGDPGAGKSQILSYVSNLAPKARMVTGRGASAAGITASVVKDEFMGGWALEAGALVLANNGIALLDELDKISREDTSAMHEAMEQQRVTISKANIQATLRAQTSILAAANPKFGRFDPYSPIASQIDLPPTLINRFDLIFTVRDIPNIEKDELIARHVLELHRDDDAKKADISPEVIRKYIAYAKQHCKPVLSSGALDEIREFYVNLRSTAALEDSEVKSIPISARQLEALIRLSEASARIRLSDKVTKRDAQRAIGLLRSCMEAVALDVETGKFDIDRIATGITATDRSRITIVRRIIDELEGRVGKNIPISDILNEAENEGLEKAKAEDVIENLKKKGDIFEPKPGLIQKIG